MTLILIFLIVVIATIAVYYEFFSEPSPPFSAKKEGEGSLVELSPKKEEFMSKTNSGHKNVNDTQNTEELSYPVIYYPEYVTDIPQYNIGYNGTLVPEYPYFYPYYFWQGNKYRGRGGGWNRWGGHGGGHGGHRGRGH